MSSQIEYLIEGKFTLNSLIDSGVSNNTINKVESSLRLPSGSRDENLFYVGLMELDNKVFISFPKSLDIDNIENIDVISLIKTLTLVSNNSNLVNKIPDGNFLKSHKNIDQLSRLGLADFLITDFIKNGEISFREHKNIIGDKHEPNWTKTIDNILPVPSKSGPIYTEWFSKKRSTNSDNVIKNIHSAVLKQCVSKYGVILDLEENDIGLKVYATNIPKHAIKLINSKLRNVYAQRDIFVLKALKAWLKKEEQITNPEFLGTRFFHMVWEEICSYLLNDCKEKVEWKSAFHKPIWHYIDSGNDVSGDSFEVDIISEAIEGKLILADAKYYNIAKRSNGILGVNDLAKQIDNEKLLIGSDAFIKKYKTDDNLENIFIFPSETETFSKTLCAIKFPGLYDKTLYGVTFDTKKAMDKYVSQERLSCLEIQNIISELR